ncbi:hypothetical protein OR1_02681 [Geobacter sp. OR-1]|uniref:hypothetical protein n=1 Tax=Geobacter sp. OR-1 TaxID=1266765 RepID=UPI00054218DA|nr:hypothetical protein [Geobacter sp. OR-1]GAM10392.1 hypothetical protein OR1_02681 [Geobacter sp. OR-1]
MKKTISTIIAIGLVSSMLVNTAYAGHNDGGINPAWIPVAIFSTIAAVAIAQSPPVVHERRIIYEPVREVRYVEPRHHRHSHYYEHDREFEGHRHQEYR